eukprot:jgi/Botrbrau1/38/Bobra.0022s0033.1
MRHWQAAAVLLLACCGTATASRDLLVPAVNLEKRGTQNLGTIQGALAFDPAATAQLDEGFVRDLTGENSTDDTSYKQLALNLTSPAGTNVSRRTVAEVNREAPLLTVPLRGNKTLSTKPHLSLHNPGIGIRRDPNDKLVHSMQDLSILPGGSGANLDLLVGVRIATPAWGSGFNFCVDRWFGSFPKIGIVIPNPVAWILPEVANLASSASVLLDFPVPRGGPQLGARVAPTSDGFVIWLPSLAQPVLLGEVAFRYGVQITQVVGVDFGFGWARTSCAIDFVRV